jgi:uncharacterized protein YciW
MKIIEKEFNVTTGETTITERDETAQEQAERLERAAQVVNLQAEAEAKAAIRTSAIEKLSALGLTTEEIAALTK